MLILTIVKGNEIMEGKQIYLLLTDTGTIFTRLIKAFTKAPYNHASIALDKELREVYSFGRKQPRNPFRAGLVKEDTSSILFRRAKCAVYSLTVTVEQFERIQDCIQKMYKQKEDYHYHLAGLFGVMLNKPIKKKNAFFCSQFVATVLKECGIIEVDNDLSLIKPSDLPFTVTFEVVYQGRLSNYTNGFDTEFVAKHRLATTMEA